MAAVETKNYNLAEGVLTINGAVVKGGSGDSFIEASRDNDFVEAETSSDGSQATFSILNDKMGTVTVSLQQTSSGNAALNAYSKAQETDGTGTFALQFVNNTDGAKIVAPVCRIIKPADYAGAKSVSERSWTIKALVLDFDDLVEA